MNIIDDLKGLSSAEADNDLLKSLAQCWTDFPKICNKPELVPGGFKVSQAMVAMWLMAYRDDATQVIGEKDLLTLKNIVAKAHSKLAAISGKNTIVATMFTTCLASSGGLMTLIGMDPAAEDNEHDDDDDNADEGPEEQVRF